MGCIWSYIAIFLLWDERVRCVVHVFWNLKEKSDKDKSTDNLLHRPGWILHSGTIQEKQGSNFMEAIYGHGLHVPSVWPDAPQKMICPLTSMTFMSHPYGPHLILLFSPLLLSTQFAAEAGDKINKNWVWLAIYLATCSTFHKVACQWQVRDHCTIVSICLCCFCL